MASPLNPGESVLVTGLDGPLARAIVRRLAIDCPSLMLAAPALHVAREAAVEADYLRALHHCSGSTQAVACDLAQPGQAGELLAAARNSLGRLNVVVACGRVTVAGAGDGAPVPVTTAFDHMLAAVAALRPEDRPRAIVLAARAFPPLEAADARGALAAAAFRFAAMLDGTTVHVFAALDPQAGAAARAFGLMDRPFGADVESATRRLEGAADAVHALLAGGSAITRA